VGIELKGFLAFQKKAGGLTLSPPLFTRAIKFKTEKNGSYREFMTPFPNFFL